MDLSAWFIPSECGPTALTGIQTESMAASVTTGSVTAFAHFCVFGGYISRTSTTKDRVYDKVRDKVCDEVDHLGH